MGKNWNFSQKSKNLSEIEILVKNRNMNQKSMAILLKIKE